MPSTPPPPPPAPPKPRGRWRTPVAVTAIIIAGVLMIAASLGLWLRRQALDTKQWTTTSTALLQNEQVRHGVAVYLVDTVFDNADVADAIADRLAPGLPAIDPTRIPLVRNRAIALAEDVVAQPAFQRVWVAANVVTHRSLLDAIDQDGATGDSVTLDLRPLLVEVRARLGLDPPSDPNAGRLVVLSDQRVADVRAGVRFLRTATLVLWIAVGVLLVGALWIGRFSLRRVLAVLAWTLVAVGLVLIAARVIGGNIAVDAIATGGEGKDAATEVWTIATTLLRNQAYTIVAIGVALLAGTWLAGRSRRATALRGRLSSLNPGGRARDADGARPS